MLGVYHHPVLGFILRGEPAMPASLARTTRGWIGVPGR